MQYIDYITLTDIFKLFYMVMVIVVLDDEILHAELLTDEQLEFTALDQALTVADMQDKWTIGLPQHGVDPVDSNVAVCGCLAGGQGQLQMDGDSVIVFHKYSSLNVFSVADVFFQGFHLDHRAGAVFNDDAAAEGFGQGS